MPPLHSLLLALIGDKDKGKMGDGKWIAPEFWMMLTIILGCFFVWVSGKYIGGLIDTVNSLKEEVIRLRTIVERMEEDVAQMKSDLRER